MSYASTAQAALAQDVANMFAYEFTQTALVTPVGGTQASYTVIATDLQTLEHDAWGGPMQTQQQTLHFQASQLSSLPLGSFIVYQGVTYEAFQTTLSADGNHFFVQIRPA